MAGKDIIEEDAWTAMLRQEPELAQTATPGTSPAFRTTPSVRVGFAAPAGAVVGELVALADEGCTPLVVYPGQPGTAALRARSVVDLHGPHIGRPVVLMFERGDATRPLVMGVVRQPGVWPLPALPGQVEVDVDGERMLVTAKDQLVLRCGAASITLTRAGKVLIAGSYVLSRSSGLNQIDGASVHLN
jgi:hypothetical protein